MTYPTITTDALWLPGDALGGALLPPWPPATPSAPTADCCCRTPTGRGCWRWAMPDHPHGCPVARKPEPASEWDRAMARITSRRPAPRPVESPYCQHAGWFPRAMWPEKPCPKCGKHLPPEETTDAD